MRKIFNGVVIMAVAPVRFAINGFGRIGRLVYRAAQPAIEAGELEAVAINDLKEAKVLAHLFKYDSAHGTYEGEVSVAGDIISVNGRKLKALKVKETPENLPWSEYQPDWVVESTGLWRTKKQIGGHFKGGAGNVILTVPSQDQIDYTVVLGVNEEGLFSDINAGRTGMIVSNASCTTNCLAPLAKTIDEAFGVEGGFMATVHSPTNDQVVRDGMHSDLRRARAADYNIIPTTTGAAAAIGKVYAPLDGRPDGMALRVPVQDGSLVYLVVNLRAEVTSAVIHRVMAEAAGRLPRIIGYVTAPIVSSDILGNTHSCIFDADPQFSKVLPSDPTRIKDDNAPGRMAQLMAWYDNEVGYSTRVVDIMRQTFKARANK